jgi:hypothetical protein
MGPNRRRDSTSIGPSLLRRILQQLHRGELFSPLTKRRFSFFSFSTTTTTNTTTPFLSLLKLGGGFNYRPMRSIAIFHSAPTFASLSAQQQIGNSFFFIIFLIWTA